MIHMQIIFNNLLTLTESEKMKFMLAVLLIILGSILVGLTSNSLGATGNNIMHLAGIGCLIAAIFIAKGRKYTKRRTKRECDV
ncbi:hypothetical protein ACPS01_25805 [Priestia aryabhattai]